MDQYKLFVQQIDEVIKKNKNKTAITFIRQSLDEEYSFSRLGNMFCNMQKNLNALGFVQGDRVALVTSTSAYGVIAMLSLAYCGITTVIIDSFISANEIEETIDTMDVKAVFIAKEDYENIKFSADLNIPWFDLIQCDNLNILNSWNSMYGLKKIEDGETDVIVILFSSGTTGRKKGVKITYKSILKAREIFVSLSGLRDYMTLLLTFPLNHIAGYQCAMTYFLSGCGLGLIEDLDSTKIQSGLLKYNPYCFAMVPAIYEIIEKKIRMKVKERGSLFEVCFELLMIISRLLRKVFGVNVGKYIFKSINRTFFGKNIIGLGTGATASKNSTAQFFLDLGFEWLNFYASTEGGVPIVATSVNDKYPYDTVGNIYAHPEVEVCINNPDVKGIGEIFVKSELVMKGYFREEALTKNSFKDGYFCTGDYGWIDKKGNLRIVGRVKESVLLRTGEKVSLENVDEYYINNMEKSVIVASKGVAMPDDRFQEIHLFVENKGYSEKEKSNIEKKLKQASALAPAIYKVNRIFFINEIPRTSIGKVKRFCLEVKDDTNIKSSKKKNLSGILDAEKVVLQCINSVLGNIDEATISVNTKLKDIEGIDSLKLFEVCVEIYEMTGVSIETLLVDETTIEDVIGFIQQRESDLLNVDVNSTKTIIFDTDGTLTDFNAFIEKYAIPYFEKKYGMKTVQPNELEIEDIMDMNTFFENLGLSEESAKEASKNALNEFWVGPIFLKYIFKIGFRNNVKSFINTLSKSGYEIQIHTSRLKSSEKSFVGLITRILTLLQYWLHGIFIGKNKFFFYEDDVEKINGILREQPIVAFEDKTFIINNLTEHGINTVCIRGKHNLDIQQTSRIYITEGFEQLSIKEALYRKYNINIDLQYKLKRQDRFYKRWSWITCFVKIMFHPIVLNRENIIETEGRGIVYAPNHRSTLDPIIITSVLNKNIRWAALLRFFEGKDSIFNNSKNPVLCKITSVIFNKMGYFPIERKKDNLNADNYDALIDMKKVVDANASVGIFGEGTTRTPAGQDFGEFDETFLVLAKNTDSVVQPITILWIEDLNIKHKVIVNIGSPIYVKGSIDTAMNKFMDIQKKNIRECYMYKKELELQK